MIGKRPKLTFPRLAAGGSPKPARRREAYFSDPRKPCSARSLRAKALGAGSDVAGPRLIQEHGTTTVLFERDTCTVAPSGELINLGGRRIVATPRPRHARGHPQTRCPQSPTRWRPICSARLQHDDLRGARFLQPRSSNAKGELICQNVGGVSHFVADLGVIITDGIKRYARTAFRPAMSSLPITRRWPASTSTKRRHLHAVHSTRASC